MNVECELELGKNEVFEAFNEAILSAYGNNSTLDRLLVFRMDITRRDYVPDGPYTEVVFNLLMHLKGRGQLTQFLECAYAYNPDNPKLKKFAQRFLSSIATPNSSDSSEVTSFPPPTFRVEELERTMRKYVTRVGRVDLSVPGNSGAGARGTGFLVGPDLFLTCHYMLPSEFDDPATCQIFFPNIEEWGLKEERRVSLAEGWRVAHSPVEYLDYRLIRLAENVGNELIDSRLRGWCSLAAERLTNPEKLLQFHFPHGSRLAISFVANLSSGSDSRLRYQLATKPGSGGAPCLTKNGMVYALHERRTLDGLSGEGIHSADIIQDLLRQNIVLTSPPGDE